MKITIVLIGILAAVHATEFVLTPGGYRPASCVHEFEHGTQVEKLANGGMKVISPDGNIKTLDPCNEKMIPISPKNKNVKHFEDNGWIIFTSDKGQDFTSFNGSWTVPKAPHNDEGQTIFLFTSFMDAGEDEIIQPVLQYGPSAAGGGSYWTVGNWWVTNTGQASFSKLIKVEEGDTIFGWMTQGNPGTWTIGATINGKNPSHLTVSGVVPQQVATVTLEVYTVEECSDYPPQSVTFTGLVIEDQHQSHTPQWVKNEFVQTCKEDITINDASSVTLIF